MAYSFVASTPWPTRPIHVQTRTFCCCIPVRIGTIILALLVGLMSASIAVEAIRQLFNSCSSWWQYWATIASVILWISLCVIAMYGLCGAWFKKREWTEWFYELCWWHIWVNVGLGIWWLILYALPGSKALFISTCLKAIQTANPAFNFDADTLNTLTSQCKYNAKVALLFMDFCWAAGILLELWLVLIVGHTLDELEDWDAAAKGFDLEGPPPFKFVVDPPGRGSGSTRSKSGRSRSGSVSRKGSSASRSSSKGRQDSSPWV